MPVIIVKFGDDAQVIAVTDRAKGIKREVKDATTFRDAVGIVERRLPSPSPTIEFERYQARKAIDSTTHLTPAQKSAAQSLIANATESDKIVFDGPYPLSDGGGLLDQGGAKDGGEPPRPPLVIVFLDP